MYPTKISERTEGCPAQPEDSVTMASSSDVVLHAFHDFIQEERMRSFKFLAQHSHRYMQQNELLVASPAEADHINLVRERVNPRKTAGYDVQYYTFTQPLALGSLQRTVAFLVPYAVKCSIHSMKVVDLLDEVLSYVTPATTWFHNTYDWDTEHGMQSPDVQNDEQRMWWDNNGKTFRLLDLPPELRETVYLHTIGCIMAPITHTKRSTGNTNVYLALGISTGPKTRAGRYRDPDIQRPNMSILQLNKQIHKEATEVAYRDTTKRICTLGRHGKSPIRGFGPRLLALPYLLYFLPREAPHPAFLRHIQLEMSARTYFNFVGIQARKNQPLHSRRIRIPFGITSLRTFPALRSLDFRFVSPKHPDAACPWSSNQTRQNPEVLHHSCQKLWIDWFFVFAWDALIELNDKRRQGVKNSTKPIRSSLSGCVKDSTRKHWQSIFDDECMADYTDSIKAGVLQIRRDKTDTESIPCHCSTPCSAPWAEESRESLVEF
ncbi:hypothetical protein N0V83_004368 [Neocucurbitaria cava]|uniref:Uncharacterized protein n=1 Tax=Neocucurbitaria cava TaxID=798079 RepID=A0A9W8Y9D2_9PLEO|nr:hypothetical protein N0V83_004368 [Neocucurbitaria cava]